MSDLIITKANKAQYENTEIKHDGNLIIEEQLGRLTVVSVSVTGRVIARAGCGIEAGWGIKAGCGIEAGEGIEAGGGIEAGWGIKAKFISCALRIFAGLCLWRFPTEAEMTITSEIRNGTVAFGRVVAPTKDGKASI